MATLYLKGFIRDATYTPHLNPEKMEEVAIDKRTNIQFTTRLKLTGNLIGSLLLPCVTENVFNFCAENRLTQTYQKRLISLNQEASENNKLQIWITGRHA